MYSRSLFFYQYCELSDLSRVCRNTLYNKGNVLTTKGGDSACPLPLPTHAHSDSALLPVLGVIAIRGAKWREQAEGEAPWNVMSWW
jgi:hypothetical protein